MRFRREQDEATVAVDDGRLTADHPSRWRLGRRFDRVPLPRFLRRGRADQLSVAVELPPADSTRMGAAIEEALLQREPSSRRAAMERVLAAYASLNTVGRERFFELLATEFGVDPVALDQAIDEFRAATDDQARVEAERRLARAVTPRYAEVFHVIAALQGGVKRLVDLRGDLLSRGRRTGILARLDDELIEHLSRLFHVGTLQLVKVTWEESPAALLERLIAYEAVHEINGWDDLKYRLHSARRCYAFLHPNMPNEPLVFVEVALTRGLAGNLPALLDPDSPPVDPNEADTAIFYSITNCQPGLGGVALGNELIKSVVERLRGELPNLRQFATLSPVPGFRAWAERQFAEQLLTPGELEAFGEYAENVAEILSGTGWVEDSALAVRLRAGLLSMCARYLMTTANGRCLDPVEHFHLANGARVERINWLANPAEYELKRSYGLMANYLYSPSHIVENVDDYVSRGTINASGQVRSLIR